MKSVLVTAVGIVIGETKEDLKEPVEIIGSMFFNQEKLFIKEEFNQFLEQHKEKLLEILKNMDEEVISDKPQVIDFLRQLGFKNARFASTGELKPFRTLISGFLEKDLDLETSMSIIDVIRDKAMDSTRFLLREKVEARDVYIAQAINSIDDINAILNLIYARLSEWYGIHFPELNDLVRDNNQYIRLISKTGEVMRSSLDEDLLSHLSEKRRKDILHAAKISLGADISKFDMTPISQFASFGVEILNIKETLESYIEESMKEVAPNLQYLVGSLLGARLISLAGSLENLAKSSSGTIQVLGAEKALFRHLRSGENPPKHGVIFQSPFIHSAKKHQRGKIARALAGKLSIASRVDFFSGEFIGSTLLQELEKRIEEIKSTFPEPSERQLEQKLQKKKFKRKSVYKKGKYRTEDKKRKPERKREKKRNR